ncbi:hypothetical protein SAMN05443665_1003102 [Actinomadura meyerae]|jgi:hypothetical protein|uniref:Uncharacterized protein n=1 Tax=Actinomadura meyerae TaxID=240840 RepID=A0A239DYS3_9ACTN|nr:hypothetical protein [Actinomadura meyerae]SNS36852.1 hypothetical protein SAMN05443665_1003102 [Actinomadura meyerae]
MGQTGEPVIDPEGLTAAQLLGDACVVCRKKWPRPRVRVGRLPDSTGVFACDDCAPAPPAPRPRRGPREARTDAGRPVGEPAPVRAAGLASVVVEVSPGRRVTRAFGGKPGTTPQARPAGGGRTRRRDP